MIEFLDAEEATFESSVKVAGTTIKVIPQAGVDDPEAPCGGMLYNQEG